MGENGKYFRKKFNIEICSEAVNQDNYSVTSVGVVLCYCITVSVVLSYTRPWEHREKNPFNQPLNSQDLIVNSPLLLLHIFLLIRNKNLVLDQDNNFNS